MLGFDATGAITNQVQFGSTWDNIVDKSIKILSFMDVGGDRKFSSTQVRTLMTNIPDYAMLFINPTDKITEVTREHFRMAKSLQIPMIVILTHSDTVTSDQHREALSEVNLSYPDPRNESDSGSTTNTPRIQKWKRGRDRFLNIFRFEGKCFLAYFQCNLPLH